MYLSLELLLVVSVVNGQFQSPCPNTFRYERDRNGELYGVVGVYSFDENVELNVELSVGNYVKNYNGQIQLSTPKDQVINTIRTRRPIQYKVLFPRWENVPPKVTRIMVNGREVCTGPSLQFDGWMPVITSVNLQHRFMKVSPLGFQGPFNNNNVIRNENPFLRRDQSGTKDFDIQVVNVNGRNDVRNVQNPFLVRENGYNRPTDYDDFLNVITTTTLRPSTRKTRPTTQKTPPVNDLLFSENPFLNPRASQSTEVPRTSQTSRPRSNSPRVSNTCGNPVVPNPLIFNGNAVPRGAFPWLAAMFASTGTGVEYKCCGSLVSTKHVITAAHCVTLPRSNARISTDKLLFVLGKLNIQNLLLGEGEKMVGAENISVHPDYRPLNADADIAVIVLSQVIEFSNYIRPVCLWSGSDDIDAIVGQKGKVVGWGRDEKNNAMTVEPKQTTIPIVSQEQCLRSAEDFAYFTSNRTFCAGERNDSGPCNGDSGSGFVMKLNNLWFLRGIVSLSRYDSTKQSCDLSNYVVFTDVSKFRTWLLLFIT